MILPKIELVEQEVEKDSLSQVIINVELENPMESGM